jgi:hypothetical protein
MAAGKGKSAEERKRLPKKRKNAEAVELRKKVQALLTEFKATAPKK